MIEVSELCYRYPDATADTLQELTFAVRPGEVVGLLGPSGAGKSTTLQILSGLLKEYRGSVRLGGQEVRTAKSAFYHHVGVAYEVPCFYERFTGLENLQFFRSLYENETDEPEGLLERAGLAHASRQRVEGWSKGMKMRLNFCRALLHRPTVLLLDEPTAGLDPGNAQMIKDWIRERAHAGTTIVITTHNMHVAEALCDRVAFMVNGCIRLMDSPRRLKVERGNRVLRVEFRGMEGELQVREFPLEQAGWDSELIRLLRETVVETVHTQEATLEHIFLEVTGRRLT